MNIFEDLIIFEMANSHQGSVEHGKNIIRAMGKIAREHGVKAAVKLQYRDLDTFIHPDYKGRKDVNHIPRFESTRLNFDDFSELVAEMREQGVVTMSTPFDENGVDWCIQHNLDVIKVASCSNMDWPLLEKVAAANKPVIISTGGRTLEDIDKIYNFFLHRNCEFAFMHCVAIYPAPAEMLQMDIIDRMKKRYPGISIGYSGHEDPNDVLIPMIAVAKGATIFERHVGLPTETITLNAYSMNPEQAQRWVSAILSAKKACIVPNGEKVITDSEQKSLQSLSRGVFAKKPIKKGEAITRDMVFYAMPCLDNQLTSGAFKDGMIASSDYAVNDALYEKKLVSDINIARSILHQAKSMLHEANIAVGNDFEVEISHHYGLKHFYETGAVLISVINREYCKKLMIMFPNQSHPMHTHRVKEETFQLLYGELDCIVDGVNNHMMPGDTQVVLRNSPHSFSSKVGAIFEEVSTTHIKGDSHYDDPAIQSLDLMQRKTILKEW